MYCRSRSTSSVTCCSLSMFSTRLSSSALLTGLERKSSVPACTARSMSPSSFSAVTIRIMMLLVAGSLLSFLQTSKPLSLGIMMSSRIRCGLNDATLSSVSCPSTATAVSTSSPAR